MGNCLQNIANQPPPGNYYCRDDTCALLQPNINKYCASHNMGPDEPYPTFAKDGSGPCYCCCSCFAFGTPIEVQPDLYKLIQSIKIGDTVLATGPNVSEWKETTVTNLGGIAPEVEVDFMVLGQFRLDEGNELRTLIASADHLFLNGDPDGATLISFASLRPGHQVRTATGGLATVVLTSYIQFSGGVRHIMLGPWNPEESLDGHLLNSNGLVTADLSVQLSYYSGAIQEGLVHEDDSLPPIGSAEFHARYDTAAYTEFVNDPKQWPPHCHPINHGLLHIPLSALGYLTSAQAADVQESLGQQNMGASMLLTQALYLFNIFGGFYKNVTFVADWANQECNAWWFVENRQRYIVVSGGLLRVPGLMVPGLSIVLSHLMANNRLVRCTADADFQGIANELHEVWYNQLFFQMFNDGMPQIEGLFARISEANRQGDPEQLCSDPGIDCRIQSLWAGASLANLPDCAVPPPEFAVTGAAAESLTEVTVTFNKMYNQPSAADPANYDLSPRAYVREVREDSPSTVRLVVDTLKADTGYTVTVSNVYSGTGKPLSPGFDSTSFTTPPEVGS